MAIFSGSILKAVTLSSHGKSGQFYSQRHGIAAIFSEQIWYELLIIIFIILANYQMLLVKIISNGIAKNVKYACILLGSVVQKI